MGQKDLLWVAADPKGQTPKETLTQIRRQVMKSAVEAKKRKSKNSGCDSSTTDARNNAEQQQGTQSKPPESIPKFIRGKLVLRQANGKSPRPRMYRDERLNVPARLPLTGIEKLVSQHGLDHHATSQVFGIINFETLCSHFLNAHPEMLSQLFIEQDEHANGYFGHVVRYYGHIECLDDALQAVVARVQANLAPQPAHSDLEIDLKYGKALRSLQDAISSDSWHRPEVLCATQLLALFEVLQSRGLDVWRSHMQGAAKIMRMRGPGKHRTPFDINLFLNLYPAICCEAFMKCQSCLFADPEWLQFVADITDREDSFGERGRLPMASAALLFRAVDCVPILLPLLIEAAAPDDSRVLALADELSKVTEACAAWFKDFDESFQRLVAKRGDWSSHPRLRITYATGSMVHMALCRLVATVLPAERTQFERVAQMRASELMSVVAGVPADQYRERLILRQERNLALGTLLTGKEYEEQAKSGKLITLSAFLKWCQIISDSAHTEFGDLTYNGAFIRFSNGEMAKLMSGQPGFSKEEVGPDISLGLSDKFQYKRSSYNSKGDVLHFKYGSWYA